MAPTRVCLVTTVQPSSNPRLVKEADALAEAGYEVSAVGAWYSEWAAAFDQQLLADRRWRFASIDWQRSTSPWLFWKTRLRHRAARVITQSLQLRTIGWRSALFRLTPELIRTARSVEADLYIAHNLGALPAALAAAARHGAAVGFDAEDFHSGEVPFGGSVATRAFLESVERRVVPRCTYLTAASPMIADAYARLAGVRRPTSVLNVFPLSDRPASFSPQPGSPVRLYWFSQTIGPDRGLQDVVRAMGQLREWPLELHLRGTWTAGFRKELMRLADACGVRPNQIVDAAPGPPGEMVRLAAEHDIGLALEQRVSVNRDIALTNKIFVYLLAGNAVIATRTCAQAALCADLGDAVRTYEPADVAGLAHALRGWLADRQALAHARAAAWQLGSTRYNWDTEQHVFLATVREALVGRAAEAALAP